MNRLVALSALAVGVMVAMAAAFVRSPPPVVRGEESVRTTAPASEEGNGPYRAVGGAGCASAACHGGPADTLSNRPEAHAWAGAATHFLAADPHTKAYDALKMPLAANIMKRLKIATSATEDVRCLACHTNPSLAAPLVGSHELILRQEGVSCEGCHGNAQKWLHDHTTWTPANRAAGYQRSGMAKLFDLGERALVCMGCHVGAPADASRRFSVRDMNHDMIAAGHPRLNFDFAEYQRRLPPHWFEEDPSPEFAVRAWLVGRMAQGEAMCRLRDDRGTRNQQNDPRTPWPEFADYRCVSCHHDVGKAYSASTGKLGLQTVWPNAPVSADQADTFAAERKRLAAASAEGIVSRMDREFELGKAVLRLADRDSASQIYSGLAAREQMLMKREGRTTFDPAFDRLAKALTAPRGNIDFTVSAEARADLKMLLEKKD